MTRVNFRDDVEACEAHMWLPGRLLIELGAVVDGLHKVTNPYRCWLPAEHPGEHWSLGMEATGEVGHWIVWSGAAPPRLLVAGFCHATLETFDLQESVYCRLAREHQCRHLGYGHIDADRPGSAAVSVCW
ncbi:hypothetical protein [Frankia sp. AvcI1]|uniref:hypothetical protein n=1 Tax=Frankia sp. AvcI1 TaxID=573496 RepID=UPI0021182693|nr:hypothetical protein [Frankia sp. AvcI1]